MCVCVYSWFDRQSIDPTLVLSRPPHELQMPLKDKVALADFVIDNNGDREQLTRAAIAMWDTLVDRHYY